MLYDGIDDKSLDRSLWILKNISKIRIFIKVFLTCSIFVIYFILVSNIILIINSSNQHLFLYNDFLVNSNKNYNLFNAYLKENAPVSLSVKSQGYSTGFSKIYTDFYALVVNDNEKYKLSSFDYYFVYNGEVKTPTKKANIPVSSEKYVFVRGVFDDSSIDNPELVVENLRWSLINLYPKRPNRFIETKVPYDCEIQKNNLLVSEEKINNLKDGSSSVNVFSFKITNNSLNNYNIINNKIVFFDNSGDIIYVLEKEMSKIKSGNSVSSSINLPGHLQEFGSVLVLPEVNMCLEESYMDKEIINTGV